MATSVSIVSSTGALVALLSLAFIAAICGVQLRRSVIEGGGLETRAAAASIDYRIRRHLSDVEALAEETAQSLSISDCNPTSELQLTRTSRVLLYAFSQFGLELSRVSLTGPHAMISYSWMPGDTTRIVADSIVNFTHTQTTTFTWRRDVYSTVSLRIDPTSARESTVFTTESLLSSPNSTAARRWLSFDGLWNATLGFPTPVLIPNPDDAASFRRPLNTTVSLGSTCVLSLALSFRAFSQVVKVDSGSHHSLVTNRDLLVVASTDQWDSGVAPNSSVAAVCDKSETRCAQKLAWPEAALVSRDPQSGQLTIDRFATDVPRVMHTYSLSHGLNWTLLSFSDVGPAAFVPQRLGELIGAAAAAVIFVAFFTAGLTTALMRLFVVPFHRLEDIDRLQEHPLHRSYIREVSVFRSAIGKVLQDVSVVRSVVQPGVLRSLHRSTDDLAIASRKRLVTFVRVTFTPQFVETTLTTARTVLPKLIEHIAISDGVVESVGGDFILFSFDADGDHANRGCHTALEVVDLLRGLVTERHLIAAIVDTQDCYRADLSGGCLELRTRNVSRAPVSPALHLLRSVERLVSGRLKEVCCVTKRTAALLTDKELVASAIDCVQPLPTLGNVEAVVLCSLQTRDAAAASKPRRRNDIFNQMLQGNYPRALGAIRRSDITDVHFVRWQRLCEDRVVKGDNTPYVRDEIEPWAKQ